jgi:hypothetical protein
MGPTQFHRAFPTQHTIVAHHAILNTECGRQMTERRETMLDFRALLEPDNPIGIAWMIVLFVGIVFWAFRKRRRRPAAPPPPTVTDGDEA